MLLFEIKLFFGVSMLKKVSQLLSFQGVILTILFSTSQQTNGMEYFRSFFTAPSSVIQATQQQESEKPKIELHLLLIGDTSSSKETLTTETSSHQMMRANSSPRQKDSIRKTASQKLSSAFVARSPKELNDLKELFSEKYALTLRLQSNGSYPSWYKGGAGV